MEEFYGIILSKKIAIISCLLNIASMVGPIFVVYFNGYLKTSSSAYGVLTH